MRTMEAKCCIVGCHGQASDSMSRQSEQEKKSGMDAKKATVRKPAGIRDGTKKKEAEAYLSPPVLHAGS